MISSHESILKKQICPYACVEFVGVVKKRFIQGAILVACVLLILRLFWHVCSGSPRPHVAGPPGSREQERPGNPELHVWRRIGRSGVLSRVCVCAVSTAF